MQVSNAEIFKMIFLYLQYKCYEVYSTYSVAFSHWVTELFILQPWKREPPTEWKKWQFSTKLRTECRGDTH